MLVLRFAVFLFLVIFIMEASATEPSSHTTNPKLRYYQDRERGWFWFEEPPVKEPEEEILEETPAPQPKPEESEKVRIDVEWLREKIPEYQVAAINNPTRENIARFMYVQRYMLDLSSRFATKTMEFMQFESALDETKRRPVSSFSLNAFKMDVQKNIRSVISKLNKNTHIWFFYSSDCPYCIKQIPVIKETSVRFGLDVLAISIDGERLPGMEMFEHVVDTSGVAERFGVRFTPTTFLAFDGDKGFSKLGEGLTDLPTIQDRILLSARMRELITEEEYQSTRDVREINVLEKDGVMYADKSLLDSDPGYLAEILRQRLEKTTPSTGNLLNEEAPND